MAGYLDTYGVAEERRRRLIKKILAWGLPIIVVSVASYFYFRTWSEERVVKQFLSALERQDFQGGYKLWGCTQDTPCPGYPPNKFTADWGPSTPYSRASEAKIDTVDFCDNGVVVSILFPSAEPVSLWVDRASDHLSFAPWKRCPGRHLQVRQFLKSLFS